MPLESDSDSYKKLIADLEAHPEVRQSAYGRADDLAEDVLTEVVKFCKRAQLLPSPMAAIRILTEALQFWQEVNKRTDSELAATDLPASTTARFVR